MLGGGGGESSSVECSPGTAGGGLKAALSSSSYEMTAECAELWAETAGALPACVIKGISCGLN